MWNHARFCGVAGRFDDDIEINFIVSNCRMAFIGIWGDRLLSGAREVIISFRCFLLTSERQERSCSVIAPSRSQDKFEDNIPGDLIFLR